MLRKKLYPFGRNAFSTGFGIFLSLCLHTSYSQKTGPPPTNHWNEKILLNGHDGPYIVNDTLYRVNERNELIRKTEFSKDSLIVIADNADSNTFSVSLEKNYEIPNSIYEMPSKMVVISDIEGKYDAFSSFLYSNKVIDENHNWIFGDAHLVLVGDFVDRGKNVTQVLWLIYKIEQQAADAGGKVHFILGNHEVLNFKGDYRYNRGKYLKVAKEISGKENAKDALKYLYSKNSEIGEWLATKNVVEKIGDYIFVHAGLHSDVMKLNLAFQDINEIVRNQFHGPLNEDDPISNFLYGTKGPFWYRGYVMSRYNYPKIASNEVKNILHFYDAKKIVIGHTVVGEISTDFNGSIIRIDVTHGSKKFSGKTKGLLIECGKEFVIDDKGNKLPLL